MKDPFKISGIVLFLAFFILIGVLIGTWEDVLLLVDVSSMIHLLLIILGLNLLHFGKDIRAAFNNELEDNFFNYTFKISLVSGPLVSLFVYIITYRSMTTEGALVQALIGFETIMVSLLPTIYSLVISLICLALDKRK